MACVAKRLRPRSAAPVACAFAALWTSPAAAESALKLFTADTIELSGDVRLVAADGEQSWVDEGFGKLRSGSDGDELRARPQLGNLDLVWQPQFAWALSATVVASLQGGERTSAGLSQAFLSFRPMRGDKVAASARAGLMWPPVSLEHEGADWHVKHSITPSAIGSWIGEEVRPVALEGTLAAHLGEHQLRGTAAVMAANDTSGTLLTFRGWALHDRTTLAFRREPLPPLPEEFEYYQPQFTHPLLEVHSGFAHRPGYYAKLSWQPPVPVRLELFRYDNRADPEDVNADLEWGWRTQFDSAGLVANLGAGIEFDAQALSGRTRMGLAEGGGRWVDNHFRAAYALLSRPFGPVRMAARADLFATRNRGRMIGEEQDERGWSAMLCGQRSWGRATGLIELLHVSSRRDDRAGIGLAPRQRQTQLQGAVRIHW